MALGFRPLEDLVMDSMPLSPDFWKGKRVLVTGHTGFKGSWLILILHRLGARVSGIALPPETSLNLFDLLELDSKVEDHRIVDVQNASQVDDVFGSSQPEIVIHFAAQSLVRRSYQSPRETFSTNLMGTVNILEAVRSARSRVCLVATTDKVYANSDSGQPFREVDPLGGHDPYSASKASTEIVVDSFRKSFFVDESTRIATARAGNVVGGGDWAADRLLPDAIRAWSCDQSLIVRRPNSIRPWQHVLDCLVGYLILIEKLWAGTVPPGPYNFGPSPSPVDDVRSIVEIAKATWGPGATAEFSSESTGPHEAQTLVLDTSKSYKSLGHRPRWSPEYAVVRTIQWYRKFSEGASPTRLCESDLEDYGVLV